ncbi:MAG: glycosyltransferase [Sphingopyxis sp.]|uniref:glycosyltransferase family 2 protein n=1 Tax=Sphingopyxis sp. TaxID=1908224 RepID=UPI002ABA4390|nr:glycosyltransferase [Sphingopyxis sp.]MDZ3830811.1 glycosyltransferase [Sphingopyxis sp.]
MQPTVSVIMPVYNVEAYVAEAIDSVLAQSFAYFELLIVDDGGSDRSIDICRSYTDSRIRIISQPNRGLAGARNTGINEARGRYIALLDSDDRWLPEKLALHVIHLDNNPDVGVSFSASRFIDQDGKPLRLKQRPKLDGITPGDIFRRNPVGNGSAPVLRRSALETVAFRHPTEAMRTCYFDESLRQSEDIELWLRLALVGDVRFAGIAPALTEYRVGGGGLSAQIVRQFDSWLGVVQRLDAYAPDFAEEHFDRARAYQLRYLARRAVQLGDAGMAMTLLRESLASSKRPLVEEPLKSLATAAAAIAARLLGPARFARLSGAAAGGRLVA